MPNLVSHHYPYLPVSLSLPKANTQLQSPRGFEALVDTGFTGDLLIPSQWLQSEELPHAYANWTMADGSEVMAPIFTGVLSFPKLSGEIPVSVVSLGEQAIIGRGVIDQFHLTLDHGKRLILAA
jgi:predicted aspartyl protease